MGNFLFGGGGLREGGAGLVSSRRHRLWWFIRRHASALTFGVSVLCLVIAIGINRNAIEKIDTERDERVSQQTEINCSLSTLVQASLDTGAFGEGIDEDDLSVFETKVVAAIGRVQLLIAEEPGANAQLAIFRRELRQLREETNCEAEDAQDRRDAREAVRDRREASKP
jgi:hypothetical protein